MKPATIIVALPVTDLDRTLRFYREGLGVETSDIDGGMIVIELPNLSLFLMDVREYAAYTDRIGPHVVAAPTPGACMFSCAIGTRGEVDETLAGAERAGGSIPGPAREADGGYMGYVSDPDGHVWELVCNETTAAAAG
ncbi:VOC family protein [Microlunatus sp. GCM10028923]|uniref:VOC family protein n=1 Tax=Microlunatus sp. GCM10028923 TaxID=3273400 RepID=UPI003621646B